MRSLLTPRWFRGRFCTAGHRSSTGHVIDWAARRGQGGAGVALMKHIGQQVDSLLAFGGSDDTLRILPHIGFRPGRHGYRVRASPVPAENTERRRANLTGGCCRAWREISLWKLMAPRAESGAWRANAVNDDATWRASQDACPKAARRHARAGEQSRTACATRSTAQSSEPRCTRWRRAATPGGYFMLASPRAKCALSIAG